MAVAELQKGSRIRYSNPSIIILRVAVVLSAFAGLNSAANPVIMGRIGINSSPEGMRAVLLAVSILIGICTLMEIAGACMTLGNNKLQRLGVGFIAISSLAAILLQLIIIAFVPIKGNSSLFGFIFSFWSQLGLSAVSLLLGVVNLRKIPRPDLHDTYHMEAKYRLFLLVLPFILLCLIFAYLPLWSWRYAFFDFNPGIDLTLDRFVGLKWFKFLFEDHEVKEEFMRAVNSSIVYSSHELMTAWMPLVFAILLSEIRLKKVRGTIQTLTIAPNLISWSVVYALVYAVFAYRGPLSAAVESHGIKAETVNDIMTGHQLHFNMWALQNWKHLGWNALVFMAAIKSIDTRLHEAAAIDGAGRLRRIWHITLPALLPIFTVHFLLELSRIISNGFEPFYMFMSSSNLHEIEVLETFIYNVAFSKGNIPLATAVNIIKSIACVLLFIGADKLSTRLTGESIIE